MNLHRLIFSTFILFSLAIPFSASADSKFIYPFGEISATSCKWNTWSTLGSDCKITLPRIEGANYEAYKSNQLYRRVYSVLWGATYDYGWDAGYGSHAGVDIATAEGTPIRAIGDGKVIISGWLSGWGNTVSIEHTLADGTKIYSNYAHMSKIAAVKWAISQGETIGYVGNTGNSYGNHLHFQIDAVSKFHPFYFAGSCAKGVDAMTLVNKGLCRDELTTYTIDPIAFIESGKIATTISKGTIEQVKAKPIVKIPQKTIKSRAEIEQEEIDEYLKRTGFEVSIPDGIGLNLALGKTIAAKVAFTKYGINGRMVQGNLPQWGLSFEYDRKGLRIFPEKIIALENGSRNFTITGLKSGAFPVTIKMGSVVLATRRVIVVSPSEVKESASAEIRAPSNIKLGESSQVAVIMKTKYGTPQTDAYYAGNWKLIATNGKAKFCNVSKNQKKVCDLKEKLTEMPFTYADTYRGVLLVKVQSFSADPISLALVRTDKKGSPIFAKTKKAILTTLPNDINMKHTYANESLTALQRGWFALQGGYLLGDRELTGNEAKSLVRNILSYQELKASGDTTKLSRIAARRKVFEAKVASIDGYSFVNRATLASWLLIAKGDPIISDGEKWFIDETGDEAGIIGAMRSLYGFRWKDQFATNYFQPKKALTKSEALYLAVKIFG